MTRCVEKLNLFVRKTNTRQFYNLTDGRFRGFQMSTSFCCQPVNCYLTTVLTISNQLTIY